MRTRVLLIAGNKSMSATWQHFESNDPSRLVSESKGVGRDPTLMMYWLLIRLGQQISIMLGGEIGQYIYLFCRGTTLYIDYVDFKSVLMK